MPPQPSRDARGELQRVERTIAREVQGRAAMAQQRLALGNFRANEQLGLKARPTDARRPLGCPGLVLLGQQLEQAARHEIARKLLAQFVVLGRGLPDDLRIGKAQALVARPQPARAGTGRFTAHRAAIDHSQASDAAPPER